MCDVCSTDSKWNTPANSPERIQEVSDLEEQKVLEKGHQIMAVGNSEEFPSFAYTFGRSIIDKPELIMVALDLRLMGSVLNSLCAAEDEGVIDLLTLADDQPVDPSVFGFGGAPFRFRRIDAYAAEMFSATNMGGKGVPAIQVIWPDEHGQWPDEGLASGQGWHYGDGSEEPVFDELPEVLR